jgi:hypothetical protein
LGDFDSEGFDFRFEDSDLFSSIISIGLTGSNSSVKVSNGISTFLNLSGVGNFSFLLLEL